jgi:hypothetical protein
MDAKRFDAWTRRRFGLGAGGLAASLLGFQGLDEAEGKKRHKADAKDNKHKHHHRKHKGKGPKCKKAGTGCKPKKRRCCNGLTCQAVPGFGSLRCCAGTGAACSQPQECCSGVCTGGACTFVS